MQPYFMPYIGYFQLINTVDKFIFYDDVTFIKQGWINRNQILVNNQAKMFTIPLSNASSHTLIKDILISENEYEKWKKSFLKTLVFNYNKAKNYNIIMDLVKRVLLNPPESISDLAVRSIIEVSKYLKFQTDFEICSKSYANASLSGQDRVLDICKQEGANTYINPINGMKLYSPSDFLEEEIELHFIKTNNIVYEQFSDEFVPFLSIIDVLMFNDKEKVLNMLNDFELV